jgi:hypothetical protein
MNKKAEIDVEVVRQINSYEHITKTALAQYSIIPEKLQYLGHSDNVTFSIKTLSEKFLLRIHQSVSRSDDNIWKNPMYAKPQCKRSSNHSVTIWVN